MLGNSPFYFSTIRKMVVILGNLFNETYITRTDSEGNVAQLIKVPLVYASKNKMLVRVDEDPEIQRLTAITLPRMSFEMTGLEYDNSRKLNTVGRNVVKDTTNANKLKQQYNPVPYNFNFNLYIYVKNAEDGTKIVEQILPFFTPDWTVSVNLIPEMNETKDIPIVLTSVQQEDHYDGDFLERRAIVWTLQFTMKGYMYGPVAHKPIIKVSKTQFYVDTSNDIIGTIRVQPGLLSNGSPTTNSQLSVNTSIIEVDDDYGFCVDTIGSVMLS